ncbi:MMPL family transporter [Nocardia sp. NPDC004604]|uniref:MMPL family transporter n=1 Tax=Nocardia sp. NPDC004604 TaxID=3157013 RepID=UPI0033BE54B3
MRIWAEFVQRHRRWILGFWAVVAIVGIAVCGKATHRLTVDFSLPGKPGAETAKHIKEVFGNGGVNSPYLISVTLPEGQRITGRETQVAAAFDAVANGVPRVRVVDEADTGDRAFRTPDDRTSYALVFYAHNKSDLKFTLPTDAISAVLDGAKPAGSTIGVTGEDALILRDAGTGGPSILDEVLLGSAGALVVLIFVFASLLAILPLVVAAVAILATFAALLPMTYLTDISVIAPYLIALIGLGVAVDYSLLIVNRWREERDQGRDNHGAVAAAMQTAGRTVVLSGLTVTVGLLALIMLPVPYMRTMGYVGALIPLTSCLTALSLTPALLAVIGPRLDWPKVRREKNGASRMWSRWAALIVRRRWIAAGSALVVLGLLIGAFSGIKIGVAAPESYTSSGPIHDALVNLERAGAPSGALTPMEVMTTADAAPAVAARLRQVEDVAYAVAPTGSANVRDGKSVVIVVPRVETVNSSQHKVVEQVKSITAGMPGVIGVAGLGPTQVDFFDAVYDNFPYVLAFISLLTFVVLVRSFRSLLLPLKAVLLNLVSLAAAYGLMVLFWQDGYGSDIVYGLPATGVVPFWPPVLVFAFLFGLSMDYEVFILARMREEYDVSGDTDVAVIEGIGRTGRLVTSAGLILVFAFGALATAPSTDLKVIASGAAFGILLDATIIRSVLVPALVVLFGKWNWYLPDWCRRVLLIPPAPVRSVNLAAPEDREAADVRLG